MIAGAVILAAKKVKQKAKNQDAKKKLKLLKKGQDIRMCVMQALKPGRNK